MARITASVNRPSDGRPVLIRQLSWLQIRASRQAAQQQSARALIAMGGAEFARAWGEMSKARAASTASDTLTGKPFPDPAAVQSDATPIVVPEPDVLDGHDLWTVLLGGLYRDFTPEQIEDLEEDDALFLGRAILALTPRRTEEQEGNAARPSTDS